MKIIALEGLDNAGKTTVCMAIESIFRERKNFRVSYELSGEIGMVFRERLSELNAIQKTLLFATDRALREQSYKNYDVVVCDRYIYSAFVYREMEGIDVEWVKQVNAPFEKPFLNIYIDVDVDTVFERGGVIPYTREQLGKCREIYLRYVESKELVTFKGLEWLVNEIEKIL